MDRPFPMVHAKAKSKEKEIKVKDLNNLYSIVFSN